MAAASRAANDFFTSAEFLVSRTCSYLAITLAAAFGSSVKISPAPSLWFLRLK